jgi:hypothetical protein
MMICRIIARLIRQAACQTILVERNAAYPTRIPCLIMQQQAGECDVLKLLRTSSFPEDEPVQQCSREEQVRGEGCPKGREGSCQHDEGNPNNAGSMAVSTLQFCH